MLKCKEIFRNIGPGATYRGNNKATRWMSRVAQISERPNNSFQNEGVCRTNVDQPANSLIKGICYSDSVRFKTATTIWGCDHEKDALEAYQKQMETTHDG